MFFENLRRPRVDRQRVNVPAHQFSGGSIDHPMSLYLRDALEGRRHDGDVEMAAFACAGVTGVFGAVVANLEQGGVQRFSSAARSLSTRRAHADCPVQSNWTLPAQDPEQQAQREHEQPAA